VESLGAAIRKRRKELCLTQTEVAGEVMSIAKLSNIETGKAIPDLITLKYLQEKLHIPELFTDEYSKEKIGFIMEQAMTYVHSGMKIQALEKLLEVQEKSAKALILPTWADAKEHMVRIHVEQGDYDVALEQMKDLENYFRETDHFNGIIDCLLKKAHINFYKKNYKKSVQMYLQALHLVSDDDKSKKASICDSLAFIFFSIHDIDQASYYCDMAMSQLDSVPKTYGVYMLQGMLLHKVGMFQLARDKLRHAKEIAIETNDSLGLANTWHSIGHLEMDLENYEEALQCFQLSLELKQQKGNRKGMARTKSYLCLLYAKQGEYDLAQQSGLEALSISRELRLELDELEALQSIGEVFKMIGKTQDAAVYLEEAIEIADRHNFTTKLKELYELIASVYDRLNEKEKCIGFLYRRMKLVK
jgi:tetratricopeptide (TPR) repeat protein